MDSKQYIKISPDFDVLYVDAEGCSFDASGDEISNDDLEMGPLFCFAIPGIEEWLRRYVDATDFVDTVTDPSFDWKTWHCEGLLFAKAISKKIKFTTEYQVTDTYIVAVPTPYDKFMAMYENLQKQPLPATTFMNGYKMYVPLRVITNALGYVFEWDAKAKQFYYYAL